MTHEVRWGDEVARKAASLFGPERASTGAPSEYDFTCGPLAAATTRFGEFDTLPEEAGPAVRSVHVVDPALGAVVFIGVLVGDGVVEIADFEIDPDYWDVVGNDPED
jgi:hypothetical protein